ncbi:hypothetical protein HanXRQr2_Chr16g0725101 [Helianthus annuus]|uniref:Uncharacterized protein n=1 Tax=Helianthus annuus TaxID=4232 RepID=A0A9K3GW44_HELAN|nr:hypothetical protein HanXRQr2_Chr16g0725101 [Helianthus annuus]
MEFDDHLTCSWSAVELINRFVVIVAWIAFLSSAPWSLTETETDYAIML